MDESDSDVGYDAGVDHYKGQSDEHHDMRPLAMVDRMILA